MDGVNLLRQLDDLRFAIVQAQLRARPDESEQHGEMLRLLAQIRVDAELVSNQNARLRERQTLPNGTSTSC